MIVDVDLIMTVVGLVLMVTMGQRLCRLEDKHISSLIWYWVGLILAMTGIGMGLLMS